MKKETPNDLKRDTPLYPKQRIKFSVGITPSVNHMYIAKTRKLTKTAEQYVREAQRQCMEAVKQFNWKHDKPFVWFYMDLAFWMPDRLRRDSHNCIKLLMDSLEGLINGDDYYIMPRIQHVGFDKENPRIDITVRPQLESDIHVAISGGN